MLGWKGRAGKWLEMTCCEPLGQSQARRQDIYLPDKETEKHE